jgi:hypothetical protein
MMTAEEIERKALQDVLAEAIAKNRHSRFFVVEDAAGREQIDTKPIADAVKLAIENLPKPESVDVTPFAVALTKLGEILDAHHEKMTAQNELLFAVLRQQVDAQALQGDTLAALLKTLTAQVAKPAPERPKRSIEVVHSDDGRTFIKDI